MPELQVVMLTGLNFSIFGGGRDPVVFVLFCSCIPLFLPFEAGVFTLGHGLLEVYNFFLEFCKVSQLKVCLATQRRSWNWTFQQC